MAETKSDTPSVTFCFRDFLGPAFDLENGVADVNFETDDLIFYIRNRKNPLISRPCILGGRSRPLRPLPGQAGQVCFSRDVSWAIAPGLILLFSLFALLVL